MKGALRKFGRIMREILLFPFRLIWWILRGFGRFLKVFVEVLGEGIEALFEGLGK